MRGAHRRTHPSRPLSPTPPRTQRPPTRLKGAPATRREPSPEADALVRHFLARTLEPVWAGLRPAAARSLAGYYKRLRTIVPEAELEDPDTDASADSLACGSPRSSSARSTALGPQQPFDSCATAETELGPQAGALERSFRQGGGSAAAPLEPFAIEPQTITEDCDDTYNRAARTIQQSFKGRYFFRIIMTVVRLNREFQRDEQLALRNRMRKLAAG